MQTVSNAHFQLWDSDSDSSPGPGTLGSPVLGAYSKMRVSIRGLFKAPRGLRIQTGCSVCHPGSDVRGRTCVCGLPSVWTQESLCRLIETNIRDQEELEGKKVPQYPCLWVNVSAVGKWAVLYHTEETRDRNQQCSYIPGSLDNYQMALADVEKVRAKFHERQVFYCFSTTQENETSVLYQRLYGPQALLASLFWPTFLLTGGLLIIAMVKINRSLSILAAQK
ncbi:calcium-activated potassium channel subunit beta-1 isoform X2 [Oryctolagus cuniculus]|uniref:calcium-activated potassium channel subunit beta-1 isoform X2 n=1 Tax=Oryctolagus cuniculus TaxID=9986 RepID=UPI003879A6A7